MGTFTAFGAILIVFAAVWILVPGLSARETRGIASGAFVVGAALLVLGLR